MLLLVPAAWAATQDDNVQWFGVRHYYDMREPDWPAAGETFTVELRVFHRDITGATLRLWYDAETLLPMAWVRSEGRYEYWRATVPGELTADLDRLFYAFRIADGADTDYYNRVGMHSGPDSRSGDFFLDLTDYADHPLGATVVMGGVVFRLWAPYATRMQVAGSWDGWTGRTDLAPNRGYWTAFVPGAGAGDEYRFRLNDRDDWWKPDPRGRAMTSSVGNSIVVDPDAFDWTDDGYRTPYYEEMVIYELHVGTFSGSGDGVARWPAGYRDVVDAHLDDLVELSVNAIELMPVQEAPGDYNWGYEPVCQFAPESAYGSPDDLRALVDRCHARGIAVLLDVKYNAGGPGDNWLAFFDHETNATYYYPPDSPNRRGGGVIGDRYNYNRTEVRDYLIDSALAWMREYHIDGFRLDHTALIKDLPAGGGEGWQFLTEFSEAVHANNPGAICIAEQWPNDPYVTRGTWDGGAGFDSQWHEPFKNASLDAFATIKYPGASANLWALWGAYTLPVVSPGTRAVNFVENHDEAGCIDPANDCWGQRLVARTAGDVDGEYAIGRAKLAAGTVLFTPGIPLLFMGQEFMEYRVWSVQQAHRPDWTRKAQHAGVAKFFRDAVRARRMYPGLRSDAGTSIHHINDGADVMALHRWGDGEDVIVVFNFSTTTYHGYRIGFPWDGEYREIVNSDAAAYEGGNEGNAGSVWASWGDYDGLPASAAMTIPRMGVLVLSKNHRIWIEDTPTPSPTLTATPTPPLIPSPTETPGPARDASLSLY